MDQHHVMELPDNDNPVLCADGKLGMLVLRPTRPGDSCGVQVHGENEYRWILPSELTASLCGAVRQNGAPKAPPGSAQDDMVQLLLSLDWAQRGGLLIDA